MSKCGFLKSWVGRCDKPTPCADHRHLKCAVCGGPATQECGETGAFVCGRLLCDEHGPGNSCIDRHGPVPPRVERVFKYEVDPETMTAFLPVGALILEFDKDPNDALCVWAQVDPTETTKYARGVRVLCTGDEVPSGFEYHKTVILGPAVLHLYVEGL